MRPVAAWGLVLALAAATVAALVSPWPVPAALAALAFLLARGRRAGLAVFLGLAVAVNGLLLAFLRPDGPVASLGPVTLGLGGALDGAVGALRLVAVFGLNVAALTRVPPARLLDGLRLPPRWTAFVAAVLIASQDLGRDFTALREARLSQGRWPEGRLARLGAAAALLPALMVHAGRRAEVRRDALRLAGLDTGPLFAPVVAVTALAAAGRVAFVALPNVALTYVVVFLGGLVFGARVGFWAGLWSMVLTNLLLSGLEPTAYANAPAMALLGLAGGLLRRVDLSGGSRMDRWLGRGLAAAAGFAGTFLFSVAADTLTWLVVPEFRGDLDLLRLRLLAGVAFNVLPAVVNAALFWLAVVPVHAAFRALDEGGRPGAGAPVAVDGEGGDRVATG